MIFKSSTLFKYFHSLYNRNKLILTITASIFFVALFIGIAVGYFLPDFTSNLLNHYVKALLSVHVEKTTLSIFSHNLQAALINYLGGFIGIIPLGALSANGFIIGAFFGYLLNHTYETTVGFLSASEFIIYTLPHGIFEIPGFIIAGAAGFRLTTVVLDLVKEFIDKDHKNEYNWRFKDSLGLFIISIILLFIAAVIEANITLPLGNLLTGF